MNKDIQKIPEAEKKQMAAGARLAHQLPAKMEELIEGIIHEREHGSSVPHFNPLTTDEEDDKLE